MKRSAGTGSNEQGFVGELVVSLATSLVENGLNDESLAGLGGSGKGSWVDEQGGVDMKGWSLTTKAANSFAKSVGTHWWGGGGVQSSFVVGGQ